MCNMQVPPKLVKLIRKTMEAVWCSVRVGGELSASFQTYRGLRQGDSLACLLFNFALEGAVRESGIQVGRTIFDSPVQILGYADDIDIVGRSLNAMTEAFRSLRCAAAKMGLEVNQSKTKYLITNPREIPPSHIQVDDYAFERVEEFIYLGSLITQDNEMGEEIKRRIVAANKCYFGLVRQMKSRALSRTTKVRLYKTLIRPVLTYGSESWTITKAQENQILRFERKIMRKIFGAIFDPIESAWRIRTNKEISELYNDCDVVQFIRVGRLRWAGHVARMSDDSVIRRLPEDVIDSSRRRGRPRLRWMDGISKDARILLGIRDWRAAARDRAQWRSLLQAALTPRGL